MALVTTKRRLGYLGLKKETTPGTGVAPQYFYKPSGDVLVQQAQSLMEIRNGNIRDLSAHVKTEIHEAGNFKTLWYASEGAALLAYSLGADSVSGASDPYTHTITLADNIPYVSCEQGIAENSAVLRGVGCKMADLTMDVAVNEPCYLTATVLGVTEDDSQPAATVSFTDSTANGPFMFNQGTVTFTGPTDATTLQAQMVKCQVKLTQTARQIPVVGYITPQAVLEQARTVEGTVDFVWTGASLYELAFNGTNTATAPSATVGSGSLAFTLTTGASPTRSVAVTMANIDFLSVSAPRINADASEAIVTATFRAKRVSSTMPISIVALNGDSAAYV